MSRAATVLQFLGSLMRYRAARAVLWFLLSLWAFDRFVYFITEAQWFASANLSGLWWARCRAQAELFCIFALICGLLTRFFLGAVTRISPSEVPPLRGKLSGFEPVRGRISRQAWALMLIVGIVAARKVAYSWSDWIYLRGGSHEDALYMGLPIGLWTHYLPVLLPFIHKLWAFSGILFVVVAVTGVLRALPQLALRQPVPPLSLTRTLWCMAAWLLFLRALLHGIQIFDLARGRALQTGDLYISAPLFGLGCLACLFLGAIALRRAGGVITRQKFSRLALFMLAALWLPGVVNWLAAPERALLPETESLKNLRESSTRKAWRLSFTTAKSSPPDTAPEKAWPMWDESSLFQVLNPTGFRGKHLVSWRNATLRFEDGKWQALVVGEGAGSTAWNSRRDASDETQFPIDRLDFSSQTDPISRTSLTSEHIFFGLEGGTLFSEEKVGIPIQSMVSQFLWAWRLRDFLLFMDATNNAGMLLHRGALERAHKVAPFWKVAGEPRLVFNGTQPYWMLDICAATNNYPGAMSPSTGTLAGSNAASDGLKMLLDARSGVISIFSVSSPTHDTLLEDWRSSLSGTLKSAGELSAALRKEWRAAPVMMVAQLQMLDDLRGGMDAEKSQIHGPELAYDAQNGVVLRAIAVRKKAFETLESIPGATGQRILQRGDFDLRVSLGAIDKALANAAQPDWLFTVASQPFVWPAKSAPGGFWVGRVFFATPSNSESKSATDAQKMEWRVAVTGVAPDSKVGVGVSVRAATLNYLGQNSPVTNNSGQAEPLEVQALRAHNAAQAAIRNSDFKTWARESERERKLLEQMIARQK